MPVTDILIWTLVSEYCVAMLVDLARSGWLAITDLSGTGPGLVFIFLEIVGGYKFYIWTCG